MSKLAKRLVSPDDLIHAGLVVPDFMTGPKWIYTDGPAVAELNASASFAPDPQQELGLNLVFAVGEDGHPAAFAFGCVCCRQNLKTGLLKQCALGWLFITEEWRIVWSAHELDTTREAHTDLTNLILDTPSLARFLPSTPNRGIYDANGQERIELASGQVLKFKARTLSGGRGLTGDKVILDEAFALKAAHVGSLLPTMTARPDGQVLYASSAGKADSDVLRDVRDRGRAGSSPRLAYVEWAAPRQRCADVDCAHPKSGVEGCALDDRDLWARANPTITTGRISIATIAALRQELPPAEFARESLGWWDEASDGAARIFGVGRWEGCATELVFPERPDVIGVAVSVDRMWASIAAASVVEVPVDPADPDSDLVERVFVAAVERREDAGWVTDRLVAIQKRFPDAVISFDEKGPTADLAAEFGERGLDLEPLSLAECAEACAGFFDKVRATALLHPSSAELDAAVDGAQWRTVGDRRLWGRRQSSVDVSMLEAATFAAHVAHRGSTTSPVMAFV